MIAFLRRESAKLTGYVASGLAATGSHYAVMVALVQWAGWWEVAASSAGFLAGAAVKYPLNYWVVFRSSARHGDALVRFAIGLAAGFALNGIILAALLATLDAHYLVSQVLTTGAVTLVNYLLARNWIFRAPAARDEVAR
ncbi:MAG: GtrA family protein [Burkholderiales bacterium]|nr:GtrA family protein [Burkholderiales bacterium]HQY46875.1 GtrA family protein [Usitatibacteraceae bacterium]